MNYIYHSVPKPLQGNILYPLNTLKEKYPDIYEKQVSKYVGREHIAKQKIPILNCLWNDVLHFCAVNPIDIKQALIEAGQKPDFTRKYYKVDPKLIESKDSVIYLYKYADNKNKLNEEDFVSYNPNEVAKFSTMPQATKKYYKEMIDSGKEPPAIP